MSWLVVLSWLRRIPWQAWALVALCGLVLAYGHWRYNAGQADVQARWDQQEAVYARQRAEATIAARKVEERHRAEYRAIAERFLADQRKADENHAATVADLRRGALRVRQHLTCPSGRPEAPAIAGVADGTGPGGLLPADAEFLLREAARADEIARQLNALIEAVEAGQK
jgi:hypothetical protein